MRTKDFLDRREHAIAYASPEVDVLYLRSEGVLCGSFGDPGAPGRDLGQENEWDL